MAGTYVRPLSDHGSACVRPTTTAPCRNPRRSRIAGSAPPIGFSAGRWRLATRLAWASAVFVVLGCLAVAMGRSAARDIRDGIEDRDGVNLTSGIQALLPTLLAAAVALVCPILILTRT